MTELMDNTGFQSSRRMFRQMLPSRSMLGWKTCTAKPQLSSRSISVARRPVHQWRKAERWSYNQQHVL